MIHRIFSSLTNYSGLMFDEAPLDWNSILKSRIQIHQSSRTRMKGVGASLWLPWCQFERRKVNCRMIESWKECQFWGIKLSMNSISVLRHTPWLSDFHNKFDIHDAREGSSWRPWAGGFNPGMGPRRRFAESIRALSESHVKESRSCTQVAFLRTLLD